MLMNKEVFSKFRKPHVKFVSYTGKYPNLCSGILKLKIDEKEVQFGYSYREHSGKLYPPFWESGGSTDWHSDYVTKGEWIIDVAALPEEYQEYADEIDYIFNKNVPHGCCGGCL